MIKLIQMKHILTLLILSTFLLSGCKKQEVKPIEQNEKIVAVGDSLTFGYGGRGTTYPEELGKIIKRQVVNEGVSGATSAQVLTRIDDVIKNESPSYVLLAIGGNDMLQRVNDEDIKRNIIDTIEKLESNGIKVILVAEPRPRAIGMILGISDAAFYKEIADKKDVILISDAFTKYLNNEEYKSDLIHLNAKGYVKTAEKIAESLKDNKLIVD
jgi:acyl-CoA thioesterase I